MIRLLVAALCLGFCLGWLVNLAVMTSERRIRLLNKRLMCHWHRLKAQSEKRRAMLIVPLLTERSDLLTIGRERRN